MIDDEILDLSNPKMRKLYNAVLGRREATLDERSAVIMVAVELKRARDTGCRQIRLPFPDHALAVQAILTRALQVDYKGVSQRVGKRWDELT